VDEREGAGKKEAQHLQHQPNLSNLSHKNQWMMNHLEAARA